MRSGVRVPDREQIVALGERPRDDVDMGPQRPGGMFGYKPVDQGTHMRGVA